MHPKSVLTLFDVNTKKIEEMIAKAIEIKKNPKKYANALQGKTLLMIFEKPSLRTRVSFQVAMQKLGGNTVVVENQYLPLVNKESIEDTARVSSRYVDGIMARLFLHSELVKLAQNATIPVINGLTNDYHPVQILCDLLTIKEKKGTLKGLKLCYLGDGNNNVTHSLIIGCAHMGINLFIGCPKNLQPQKEIVEKAKKLLSSKGAQQSQLIITDNAEEAVKDADIVYTDSWMSYHTPPEQKEQRMKLLKPFQVNGKIIKHAKRDYCFMNCLPAMRGYEQTAEIIDGKNSIVFDQAENRMHMQKAILLECLQ